MLLLTSIPPEASIQLQTVIYLALFQRNCRFYTKNSYLTASEMTYTVSGGVLKLYSIQSIPHPYSTNWGNVPLGLDCQFLGA